MGWTPGLRTPAASLDSAKGPAAAGRVRFQRFVLFRFSAGRGWIPAGVASQKTGPVAGDIARFARQHTKVARKEPRIQWVSRLDPDWTLRWTPEASGAGRPARRVDAPVELTIHIPTGWQKCLAEILIGAIFFQRAGSSARARSMTCCMESRWLMLMRFNLCAIKHRPYTQ